MATIDTSGIDALYPIAGVDNDSQGFRDNFAAIKTALESAVGITLAQELTNKTLVSPQVVTPVVTGNILLNENSNIVFEGVTADAFETTLTVEDPTEDRVVRLPNASTTLVGDDTQQTLTQKTLTAAQRTTYNVGEVGIATVTLNHNDGDYQYFVSNASAGARTVTFENFGEVGKIAEMTIEFTQTNGGDSLVFDSGLTVRAASNVSLPIVGGAGAVHVVDVYTRDGGSTIFVKRHTVF